MSSYSTISSTNTLIGNHLRRYRNDLSSNEEVPLLSFEETYRQMGPSLHKLLGAEELDLDTLNYSATRLPSLVYQAKRIIMAPSVEDFRLAGYPVTNWLKVSSPNRRRLTYWDGPNRVMAIILNSDSDIDDVVNNLLAYSLEHAKIGHLLHGSQPSFLDNPRASSLRLTDEQFSFLEHIFDIDWPEFIISTQYSFNPTLQLLPFDNSRYADNCQSWWENSASRSLILGLGQKPVYFVSSNSHNIVNIIGGFLNLRQTFIFDFLSHTQPELYRQWFNSKRQNNTSQINDFIYYLANNFLQHNPEFIKEKDEFEKNLGVITVKSGDRFPTDVQFIPVKSIAKSEYLDPNLKIADRDKLANSSAYIVNVQYPLGLAAYYLLQEIIKYFDNLRGVYIFGKGAILDGSVGDIQIPQTVFDEVTENTFQFSNVFSQFFPFQNYISNLLKDLKAVCVYGTFLENRAQLENYQSSNLNIIEMENASYLSAIFEHYLNSQAKVSRNQSYHIDNLPLDLGIINYASDNPLSQNLGQEALGFRNIESSYLSTLTAVQRIIDLETAG